MTDDVLELYRRENATAYEERRNLNPKWQFEDDCLRHVLNTYGTQINSILDAPVGTGRFLDLYGHMHGNVTVCGLDASEDMLQIARQRAGVERVEFRKQDIVRSPLGLRADLVVCYRFLNLVPWGDAARTLRNLFAATDRFLVVAIRTVEDDYQGETFIEQKIHLHKRSSLEKLCAEHAFEILDVSTCETSREGDYSVVTCAPRRAMRDSRVNKNLKLVYRYGQRGNEGKVYEVKDAAHARFIRAVTNESPLSSYFPRIVAIDGNFVDAEWVPGDIVPAASWQLLVDLLVKIQSLPAAGESSFDYVEDLVIPRFRKAAPMIGRALCETVVSAVRDLSASFSTRVSHPDVIPGNVVLSGNEPALIDNELLCRSRHHRIDILNVLKNLDASVRAQALCSYLQLSGESLADWEAHRSYLRNVWCAREVGSAVIMNQLERARACVRALENDENLLPYDLGQVQELLKHAEAASSAA